MSEMQFSKHYRDLSNSCGVDAGFQSEFHCGRCSDRWRTMFQPYRSGQAQHGPLEGGWPILEPAGHPAGRSSEPGVAS